LLAGSSAISTYTMATIQASFANAAEFFNSLLDVRPRLVGTRFLPLFTSRSHFVFHLRARRQGKKSTADVMPR
ncbi:hypothetical protein, partial [Bradyrhizobium sp. SBR1B]|uniref:hypothetical protein n=1 Tax=Bradyrhizobium sp. SBR1B TaxID=2663836 RepID=UPI001AED8DB1